MGFLWVWGRKVWGVSWVYRLEAIVVFTGERTLGTRFDFYKMANAFEGTVDREYLCEWPPTVQVKTQNDSEISKKRKLADKDNDTDEKYVEAKKDVLGCSHEFPWARPALAKWWKKRLQITKKQDMSLFPKSNNPNTLLKYLAR